MPGTQHHLNAIIGTYTSCIYNIFSDPAVVGLGMHALGCVSECGDVYVECTSCVRKVRGLKWVTAREPAHSVEMMGFRATGDINASIPASTVWVNSKAKGHLHCSLP